MLKIFISLIVTTIGFLIVFKLLQHLTVEKGFAIAVVWIVTLLNHWFAMAYHSKKEE